MEWFLIRNLSMNLNVSTCLLSHYRFGFRRQLLYMDCILLWWFCIFFLRLCASVTIHWQCKRSLYFSKMCPFVFYRQSCRTWTTLRWVKYHIITIFAWITWINDSVIVLLINDTWRRVEGCTRPGGGTKSNPPHALSAREKHNSVTQPGSANILFTVCSYSIHSRICSFLLERETDFLTAKLDEFCGESDFVFYFNCPDHTR